MAQFKPDTMFMNGSDKKFIPENYSGSQDLSRGSSVEERGTHNPEVRGATPFPASLINPNIVLGYN